MGADCPQDIVPDQTLSQELESSRSFAPSGANGLSASSNEKAIGQFPRRTMRLHPVHPRIYRNSP